MLVLVAIGGAYVYFEHFFRPGTGAHELSPQQRQLVERFGHPDAFTIAFLDEDPAVGYRKDVRVETWFYHGCRTSFTFVQGKFGRSDVLEPVLNESAEPRYVPSQFGAGSGWQGIKQSLGIEKFAALKVDDLGLETPGVPAGLTMYVAPPLVLGFAEDRLAFVRALRKPKVDLFTMPESEKGLFGERR
ncbi:MAG: hypothetical protein ACYSUN_11720 [Planctomycetota bacterium]